MFRFLKKILRDQKSYISKWDKRCVEISYPSSQILSEKSSVFTIGSCFASNLAAFMGEFNIDGSTHPGRPFYHTKAILQEFEKLVEGCERQRQVVSWETKNGFQSPYMNHLECDAFETLSALNHWADVINKEAHARLHRSDIVVITLGLIEAWYHASSDTYFKQCPPASLFDHLKPEFHRLSVQEMKEDLISIREIIYEKLGAKLIVTVSPVPLISTFMPYDIQVANNESKSRIRAAVSEFIDEFPDVYYFPSFEIVCSGERINDFMKKDGRHLHPEAVRYVISQFVNCFSARKLSVDVAKEKWLTPIEKTSGTPEFKKDFPAERAKQLADMLIESRQKIFVYGDDEWTVDFLYSSGVLHADFVGFVSDIDSRPFCGQNRMSLSDLNRHNSSWVVVAQQQVVTSALEKIKNVFPAERIIFLNENHP